MSYPYYIIDTFAEKVFEGNPAAVYISGKWLPKVVMQNIAIEDNLSETTFTVREGRSYALHWFTPKREIDLYGHATLTTVSMLFNYYSVAEETLRFISQSGPLIAIKKEEYYCLDLPCILPKRIPILSEYEAALDTKVYEACLGRDLFLILEDEGTVAKITSDFSTLRALSLGVEVIVAASGDSVDFVSWTFFPRLRIDEGPVCDSAHVSLIPYWRKRLNQTTPSAYQVSPGGGLLTREVRESWVIIGSTAKLLVKGETYLPI